jgi:hypothetical protein
MIPRSATRFRYCRTGWLTLLALVSWSRSAIHPGRAVVPSLIAHANATLRESPPVGPAESGFVEDEVLQSLPRGGVPPRFW